VVDRVAARVERFGAELDPALWDGPGKRRRRSWKCLVLTSPALVDVDARFDPVQLRAQVKTVRAAFPKFWRSTPWGRQRNERQPDGRRVKRSRWDTAAIIGQEVAPGGMVHIHAAVFGEYVPQRELEEAWRAALGLPEGARVVVHISAIRGDAKTGIGQALRECLKYATKGEKGPRRIERAAAVELALRDVRRVELYGALRAMGAPTEDVEPADLHSGAEAQCEQCGSSGAWGWFSIWRAELVQANGGFGRVRLQLIERHFDVPPRPPPEARAAA
jgi:hypothetical protein